MKLQLALDVLTLEDALALTHKVRDYVEVIEIGTPFLLEYGMEAVRRFRDHFPDKIILADTKIMDAGELESRSAFDAGADLVTVLAVTDTATIRACVDLANSRNKQVVADMICVPDLAAQARKLEDLGVHGIAVHTGVDQQAQGRTPLEDLKTLRAVVSRAELFVAGGIGLKTIGAYCEAGADVLIVGGAIANAKNPAQEAMDIHKAMKAVESKT